MTIVGKMVYGTLTFTFDFQFHPEPYGISQMHAMDAYKMMKARLSAGVSKISADIIANDPVVFGSVAVSIVNISPPKLFYLKTQHPTMKPAISVASKTSCVSVTIADTAGTGWGNAKLLTYSTLTRGNSLQAPTCRNNPNTFEYCFNDEPTSTPTIVPTRIPTVKPTPKPTPVPTAKPSPLPSVEPSAPSTIPTNEPTIQPSSPTLDPTLAPTHKWELYKWAAEQEEEEDYWRWYARWKSNGYLTNQDDGVGSDRPPSAAPTSKPSRAPTKKPSRKPTQEPTLVPVAEPTELPTDIPTVAPTGPPDWVILKIVGLETEDADAVSWSVVADGVTYVGNYDTYMTFSLLPTTSPLEETRVVLKSAEGLVTSPGSNVCFAPGAFKARMLQQTESKAGTAPDAITLTPIQVATPVEVTPVSEPEEQAVEITGYPIANFEFSVLGNTNDIYGPRVTFYSSDSVLLTSSVLSGNGPLSCEVKLPDGDYTLKVAKSLVDDSTVSWKFCGKSGRQGAELHFKVLGEVCVGDAVKYNSVSCADLELTTLEEAVVTVGGVMELHGVGSDELSPGDAKLLRNAITEEFSDANLGASPLPDHATEFLPMGALPVKRRLAGDEQRGMTKQVAFKVTMSAPKFEVADLKKYLDHSMTSGLFVTRVRSLGKAVASPRLNSLSKASLLDLHVVHQTLENEKMSMFASAVVGVCGVAGLVLATLLVVRFRRMREYKYELAPADSEHGVSI